jgi:hypothetical protein
LEKYQQENQFASQFLNSSIRPFKQRGKLKLLSCRPIRAIDCLQDRFSACNATIHIGSFPSPLPLRHRISSRQSIVLGEKERKKADARIRTPRNDGCQCKLLEIGDGGINGETGHATLRSI